MSKTDLDTALGGDDPERSLKKALGDNGGGKKSPFKIGDRVVCVRGDEDIGVYDGKEYTVEGVDTDGVYDLIGVVANGATVYILHSRFKPSPETPMREELLETVEDLRHRLAITRHSERTKVEFINYLRENDMIRGWVPPKPEPKVEREPDTEIDPVRWLSGCPAGATRTVTYRLGKVDVEYKEDRR